MKKFLKIYFKFNIFLSIAIMIYSCIAFIASTLNLEFLLHYITEIQDISSFGLTKLVVDPIYLMAIGFFGFFINQYFYNIYRTLYNFDKFREISGIIIIPIFSLIQLLCNCFIFGIFALIPLTLNILSTILLKLFQTQNKKKLISEMPQNFVFDDPAMQEKSLKIGQLRILKLEGKMSEEEFMFHLNNILEDKE